MKEEKERLTKGQARKLQIIRKAEEIFGRKGYVQASVAEIIDALGVSSGAVYRHFPTKKSILKGIGEYRFRKTRDELRGWIADESMTPGEKMEKLIAEFESGRKARMALDRIGLGAVREDREMHETFMQLSLDMLSADLTILIEQGVERGEFKVADTRAAAVTILLLFSEFVHRAGSLEKVVPWKELHKTFRYAIQSLLHQDE